jgi:hypothetical protein
MKKYKVLFSPLVILVISSCTSVQKKEVALQNNDTTVSSSTFKTLDTSLSFSGFWVNEQYATSIKKTKSPTGTEVPKTSCISIPDKTLMVTRIIYGFHEGGGDVVFVKNGKKYEVWDAGLEFKIYDVTMPSGNKLSIGDNHFVKLKYVDDEKDNRQPTILEELLFAGRYQDDNGSVVEFTDDGQVNNLGDYKTYSAIIDYADQGMNVDQIGLGVTKMDEEKYAFNFNKDTLSVYNLKCLDFDSLNNACAVVDFGALKYRLVKKDSQ